MCVAFAQRLAYEERWNIIMENNQMNNQPNYQPTYQPGNPVDNIPEEYRPISMWGYFGYELLFSIPCVGFILLLVFAFGGTTNVNVRNFARSYFCFILIMLILSIIMAVILIASGVAASMAYQWM